MMMKKTIDVCGVNLDIHEGPIGILCSGGADSSILLYHLMKNKTDDKIYIFTTASTFKKRWNAIIAPRVINKCIELTGNTNIEHIVTYCDKQTNDIVISKAREYYELKKINFLYLGVTRNPPKEVTDKFLNYVPEDIIEERNPNTFKKQYIYDNTRGYRPWANIDKSVIYKMYQEEHLMLHLFDITRSCEWYDGFHHPEVKDPLNQHCGSCWWCEERKWAFGEL